jgi:XTP/dITP diphosphohydrolase
LRSGEDTLREVRRSVYFLTQNKGKFLEAAQVAAAFGVHLKHLNIAKQEIQADRLTEIATFASKTAARSRDKAVVSEDAGLFIDALKGFPGPYSSYVFKSIGIRGILKLMRGMKGRTARFSAAVAYCEPNKRPFCFTGTVKGFVSKDQRGSQGFGFDPIFVANDSDGRTFAEMGINEKNTLSHRAKAFAKFSRWYAYKRLARKS